MEFSFGFIPVDLEVFFFFLRCRSLTLTINYLTLSAFIDFDFANLGVFISLIGICFLCYLGFSSYFFLLCIENNPFGVFTGPEKIFVVGI